MSDAEQHSTGPFASLGAAVEHELFAEADLVLRRGRHVDRDSGELYEFLRDGAEVLSPFYERLGCELVHASDGYFYLLPTTDRLGRRHLSVPEMIVGQGLALMYLEPAAAERTGHTHWEEVVTHLVSVMGRERLVGALSPSKKKRVDERVAEQTVRSKVSDALRKLAQLGFIDVLKDGQYRLRPALMRFAEPVRGSAAPEMALRALVERGEVILGEAEETGSPEEDGSAEQEEPPDEDDSQHEATAEPSLESPPGAEPTHDSKPRNLFEEEPSDLFAEQAKSSAESEDGGP